eukprot:1764686-Pyramimonas_sp.AAC.1
MMPQSGHHRIPLSIQFGSVVVPIAFFVVVGLCGSTGVAVSSISLGSTYARSSMLVPLSWKT